MEERGMGLDVTTVPQMRDGGGGRGAMTTLSEEASEFIIGTVTTALITADWSIWKVQNSIETRSQFCGLPKLLSALLNKYKL